MKANNTQRGERGDLRDKTQKVAVRSRRPAIDGVDLQIHTTRCKCWLRNVGTERRNRLARNVAASVVSQHRVSSQLVKSPVLKGAMTGSLAKAPVELGVFLFPAMSYSRRRGRVMQDEGRKPSHRSMRLEIRGMGQSARSVRVCEPKTLSPSLI